MADPTSFLTAEDICDVLRSLLAGESGLFGEKDQGNDLLDRTLLETLPPEVRMRFTAHSRAMFLPDGPEPESSETLGQWMHAVYKAWATTQGEITFHTSGSTGDPVAHRHEATLLWQEITAFAEIFAGRRRIVGVVPRHHIYGFLFTVLLPRALRVPVLCLPALPNVHFLESLEAGELVVAFPLFWKGLAELGERLTPNVHGVTSTGPCPAEAIHRLCSLGLDRMVEVYGSSETSGVGWRSATEEPYCLLPYLERSTEAGKAVLQRRLPNGGKLRLPLPDRMFCWEDDRHFAPEGRKDKAVQVGGINVYPDAVARAITAHLDVIDCAVRLSGG